MWRHVGREGEGLRGEVRERIRVAMLVKHKPTARVHGGGKHGGVRVRRERREQWAANRIRRTWTGHGRAAGSDDLTRGEAREVAVGAAAINNGRRAELFQCLRRRRRLLVCYEAVALAAPAQTLADNNCLTKLRTELEGLAQRKLNSKNISLKYE